MNYLNCISYYASLLFLFLAINLRADVPATLERNTPLQPDIKPWMEVLGNTTLNSDGNFIVPIKVTIRNVGTDLSGTFKTSAQYSTSTGASFLAPLFSVRSPTHAFTGDNFYAWLKFSLPVGASRVFTAVVVIPSNFQGQTISLQVLADSCDGEEFMPPYCRILEIRENNNLSSPPRTVLLPSL